MEVESHIIFGKRHFREYGGRKKGYLDAKSDDNHCRDDATDNRRNHRNPGIIPIGAAPCQRWQQEVGDARTQVTSRVNSITGGPPNERPIPQTSAPTRNGPNQRKYPRCRRHLLRRRWRQHSNTSTMVPMISVMLLVATLRMAGGGAEDAQPCPDLWSSPARQISQPDNHATHESAQQRAMMKTGTLDQPSKHPRFCRQWQKQWSRPG